ncbi:two-component sensor histidine kinase [Hyphomicrobium methylovorum]|uniref:ActS/PrrB/RegB family redox-sensitive histidine kinase n=1 Tax=Hyphomicrobium methylovorum TaxID=84 RepID=UPI0015E69DF7|nr:ActS/PrrB/RegB family redox-sensitive histidine kinase [Hyphomicrobium methylovorum]MBA2126451.1 two-component sensor histidine kinase [Hyphomicrobium methylovorum]
MSTSPETPPVRQPMLKGIVNDRESQLRLVTSVRLRWMAVLGQLAAVAVIALFYGFPFNIGSCLILIAMSAWLNVYLSIRFPARHRLSTPSAFGLLAYDVLQLAGLLYFTGGIQNPFSVLLVAPVTVSAATLPSRYTIMLGALVVAAGMVLISQHAPLPWYEGLRFELPRDYKIGALLALVASMVFMAFYTWRLNKEARQMSAALAATDMVLASEQRLHALDGLAAAAAHELGTPLSTIVLVAKELEHELGPDSRYIEDLQLLHGQAKRCREILQKLTKKPDEQDPMHATVSPFELFEEAAAAYRDRGKRIMISTAAFPGLESDEAREDPVGHRRPGVIYGLGNLIENAVSFAASEVELTARWNATHVVFSVADDGLGFAPEMMDSIGEPYITSRRYDEKKEKSHSGLGLGLFIAKTLLERSGAVVTFNNQAPPRRGAIVQVTWAREAFELHPSAFNWPGRRGRKAFPV